MIVGVLLKLFVKIVFGGVGGAYLCLRSGARVTSNNSRHRVKFRRSGILLVAISVGATLRA